MDTSFNKTNELRKSSSANSSNITDELNTDVQINIESDGNETEDSTIKEKDKIKLKNIELINKKDNDDKKSKKEFLVEEITSESPLFGISTESLLEVIWPVILDSYELFWRALELHMMKVYSIYLYIIFFYLSFLFHLFFLTFADRIYLCNCRSIR